MNRVFDEKKEPFITMWTVQTKQVLEALNNDGISYVKKHYISEKYGDTAWIFLEAYGFFVDKAEKIVKRPQEADSPIWMFADKKWAVPQPGSYLLKLRVPRVELVQFDLRLWSKVLNLTYLGSEPQKRAFENKLIQMGVSHSMDAFERPYYPGLKQEIKKSWNFLFKGECKEKTYIQGATWVLKKEWILTIYED